MSNEDLIARAEAHAEWLATHDAFETEDFIRDLITALRAAEDREQGLAADLSEARKQNDEAYGFRPCDAEGGCWDRSTCGDCSEPGIIWHLEREVEMLRKALNPFAHMHDLYMTDMAEEAVIRLEHKDDVLGEWFVRCWRAARRALGGNNE